MTKKEALVLSAQSASDFLAGFAKDYSRSADAAMSAKAKEAAGHARSLLEVVKHLNKMA
jgi:hypothetical protein